MRARDFFESVREASRDAERCRRQIEAMEARALSLGGGSGERVSATGEPDRMASRVAALADREAMLHRRVEEDYRLLDIASRVLYGEGNDAGLWSLMGWRADAVALHYVDGMPWAEVGRRLGYEESHVRHQAAAALDTCDERGLVAVAEGRGGAEG